MNDTTADLPTPRANPDLFGHEGAERLLLDAFASGRLPHAWLITGPPGIGKATLAFRFARFLLAGGGAPDLFGGGPTSLAVDPDHPVFQRVASGGHLDLLTLERAWDEKKDDLKGSIAVEDVRRVGPFLHMTAAEGGWRVVVVDGVEYMSRSSANALLKVLEEPPAKAVLLLVAHNPGGLLPTIRSRCRKLVLSPLPDSVVTDGLRRVLPDLPDADIAALATLAEGSLGRALALAANGGLELFRQVMAVVGSEDKDIAALHAFAESAARSDQSYRTVGELLVWWLARIVRAKSRGELPQAVLPDEAAAIQRLARERDLEQWVEVWEKTTRLLAQADAANLDRRQVLLAAFAGMHEKAAA